MAEPGDEIAVGAGGHGHLRASRADREQVIDMLKAAFVQGRLTRDEFDLRVGQALVSQTYADLAALTADIPAELTGTQPPEPARKPANKEAVTAVACVSAAWTGIWVPLVVVDGISSLANLVLVVVLISVVPVSLAGFLLYHAWLDKRPSRQLSQGPPPSAGGGASQRLAPADSAGQLPPVDHGQRHAAQAVRSDLSGLQSSGSRPPRQRRSRGLLAADHLLRAAGAGADPALVTALHEAVAATRVYAPEVTADLLDDVAAIGADVPEPLLLDHVDALFRQAAAKPPRR